MVGVEVPVVVPEVGVTVSQFALELTVKLVAVDAERLIVLSAGAVPPAI